MLNLFKLLKNLLSSSDTSTKILLTVEEEKKDDWIVLQQKALTQSQKEMLNEAMTAYGWLLDQIYAGKEIASIDRKDGKVSFLEMGRFDIIRKFLSDNRLGRPGS